MELPRPRTDNPIPYTNMIGRQSIPLGACYHKEAKAGRWRVSTPRTPSGVCFALHGECQGDMNSVMDLGIRLAREAMERGDRDLAERIVDKVKRVPKEYKVRQLMKERERLLKLMEKRQAK